MKKKDNKNKVRAPEIAPEPVEEAVFTGGEDAGISVEAENTDEEQVSFSVEETSLAPAFLEPEEKERKVLSDLENIDPDLLTGEESAVSKAKNSKKKEN